MIQKNSAGQRRPGLTPVETLVVILIVFTLLGLVVVALRSQRVREGGRVYSTNYLKQLTLANHSCNDVHKRLPPAFDRFGKILFPASVHVHLLPYIEKDVLYDKILMSNGLKGNSAIVLAFIAGQDSTLPGDGAGVQNYAANLRIYSDKGFQTPFDADMPALGAIEPGKPAIPRTFADGTSNTIVFTTKFAQCGNGGSRYAADPISPFAAYFGQNAARKKAHPADPEAAFQDQPNAGQCLTTPLMAQSMSVAGISVGLGDGSVRMVNPNISPRTWNQAVHPSDGTVVGDEGNDW